MSWPFVSRCRVAVGSHWHVTLFPVNGMPIKLVAVGKSGVAESFELECCVGAFRNTLAAGRGGTSFLQCARHRAAR